VGTSSLVRLDLSDWNVLFGGIIGVLLTLLVTWVRDVSKRKAERTRKLKWLLAEIRDNLEHVEHHTLAGGRAKVKLLTQAWETAKGDTLDLTPELTSSLRAGYAEVWRFNCIVDYDLQIPTGHGFLHFTGLLNPPNTPLLVASMRERGCPERAFLRISKISRK